MTDQPQQTKPNDHRYYPDDEIELMDYLLVVWKWKYLIIAGTLAFALTSAIISFIQWKQQPTMYRTNIVLKPGVLKIDKNGNKVFIDSPENIKTLIKNDLEHKILNDIKNSNSKNMSTALDLQVDIPTGSNIINVSLVSASPDEGTAKLNYLIKALSTEFANKIKFKQEGYEKEIASKKEEIVAFQAEIEKIKKDYLNQIEQKKTLSAELKEKEGIYKEEFEKKIEIKKTLLAELNENKAKAQEEYYNNIQLKKYELKNLLSKEKQVRNQIAIYQQILSELASKADLLNKSTEKMVKQRKLLMKNHNRNNIDTLLSNQEKILDSFKLKNNNQIDLQKYNDLKEKAEYDLFAIQEKIDKLSKEITNFDKLKDNDGINPVFQPDLYKIQKDIINVTKEIEKLIQAKDNSKADPFIQPNLFEIQKDIIKTKKEIETLEKGKNNIQEDINYINFQKGIVAISKKIEKLEKEKMNIQNIQVIQPPVTTEIAKSKTKIKQGIMLAAAVGVFFSVFLAFFLEYISKYKKRKGR